MNKVILKESLLVKFPSLEVLEGKHALIVNLDGTLLEDFTVTMKYLLGLGFDYLMCLTGTDWNTHFKVTYHLCATTRDEYLILNAKLDGRDTPQINSVSSLWPTAEFHEREVKEMLGINFINHPDPRNLLLPDDWQGFPLRKDYSDPKHIIELK